MSQRRRCGPPVAVALVGLVMTALPAASIGAVGGSAAAAVGSSGIAPNPDPSLIKSWAPCADGTGVTVIVDYGKTDDGLISVGCAPGAQKNGLRALENAGFSPSGDTSYGLAFITSIDGLPPSTGGAVPPMTAYWSYWHGDAGPNTWSYSELGATTYQPPPGSVDAWVFGAPDVSGTNGPLPFTPAQVLATTPTGGGTTTTTSTPTVPPTTAATVPSASTPGTAPPGEGAGSSSVATGPPTSGASHGSSSSGGTSHAGSSNTGAVSAGPSNAGSTAPARRVVTSPSGSSPAPPAPSNSTTVPEAGRTRTTMGGADHHAGNGGRSAPRIVDALPVAAHLSPAGSPTPFVVGALVVALVAGGGGVIAWRRRRARQTGLE